MQTALVVFLSAHVLTSTFWAGSTFALGRTGSVNAAALFRPQIGAAGVAFPHRRHAVAARAYGPL